MSPTSPAMRGIVGAVTVLPHPVVVYAPTGCTIFRQPRAAIHIGDNVLNGTVLSCCVVLDLGDDEPPYVVPAAWVHPPGAHGLVAVPIPGRGAVPSNVVPFPTRPRQATRTPGDAA